MKKHRLPAAVLALAALGFTLGTCEFAVSYTHLDVYKRQSEHRAAELLSESRFLFATGRQLF